MPIDPLSALLVAALYAPAVLTSNRQVRASNLVPFSEEFDRSTDRPIAAEQPLTRQYLSAPQTHVPDLIQLLVAEVNNYSTFEAGWDGPRSLGPTPESCMAAVAFLNAIPPGLPLPTAMLSPSGEVGLYWDQLGGYADINFDRLGLGSFFSKTPGGDERYFENFEIAGLTREWFFANLGTIAAPVLIAA